MSAQTSAQTNTVRLKIDGKEIVVPKGTTVYTAAKLLGIEVPIFCYQDRMPPFGACRVCMVEVEKMPKPQTSCTLEATEGMVVKTQSTMAEGARREILEFLLINHPLDCPICDRGGECPLQDNTLKYGPGISRFFEEKRHFKKALSLGPVLKLDRERCISCARCTRFGEIVAGDHALQFIDRGYRTEVGTPDSGPAESKFIGNTILICPVGALTSDVYRFRARPWDNLPTPSTCTLCPVGCSLFLDSRDGEIMRTRSHENRDVNDIWLCDKGWFGYEFTSHPDRLQMPLIRKEGKLQEASWDEAFSLVASKMQAAKPNKRIAALGGDSLTLEENYLLQKLMREAIGVENVDHRVGEPIIPLDEEGLTPGMQMSIGETEQLSFAILLGVDLTEEFPVIWLRLKQAINRGAKVLFLGHYAPETAKYLTKTVLHAPGEELKVFKQYLPNMQSLVETGKRGAVFVGRQYLATEGRRALLSEVSKFCLNANHLPINILEGHGNSMGARITGMHPELKPFGQRVNQPGMNTIQILETAAKTGWDLLYVVGANPALKFPSNLWKTARSKMGFLVVQDLFLNETAKEADVVLPTLSFVEKEGSFLNIEGRVQKLRPGKDIPEAIYSDAEIFTQLGQRLSFNLSIDSSFAEKLALERLLLPGKDIPVESISAMQKNDGELRATFAPILFDHGVRMKHNPHLVQLAKEPVGRLHPQEGERRNIRDGDRVNVKHNGHSIKVKIALDVKVAKGTLVLPLGFAELPVQELSTNLMNGLAVELNYDV